MTVTRHPRAPLVLTAARRALEHAAELGVDGCLENLVRDAIVAGNVVTTPREGGVTNVLLGDGVRVAVRRVRAESGRLAWQPFSVSRRDRGAGR
jgi:hypothetical protein